MLTKSVFFIVFEKVFHRILFCIEDIFNGVMTMSSFVINLLLFQNKMVWLQTKGCPTNMRDG
jgi:hypothetical protein